MIQNDQPTIFNDAVVCGISSVGDGTMKYDMASVDPNVVDDNRRRFLAQLGISPQDTVLVHITYDTDTFTRYHTIGTKHKGDGITHPIDFQADALVTREKNIALFLPLADCVGAIFYDKRQSVLMVSHLGRHNIEQFGAQKNIQYLNRTFGSRVTDIQVWLGPAPSKASYPLYAFTNRSLHEVACEQLLSGGIKRNNIEICLSDTATDKNYYSHSEFKKGHRSEDGRFAVVATMR